ncbi:MAG: hypothetical protein ACOYNI_11825 [Acidimicrobiia bacterium]
MASDVARAIRADLEFDWNVGVRSPDGSPGMLTLMSSSDPRVQYYDHGRFRTAIDTDSSIATAARWTNLYNLETFIDELGLVPETGRTRANAVRVLEAVDGGRSVVVALDGSGAPPLVQLSPIEDRPGMVSVVRLTPGAARNNIAFTTVARAALTVDDEGQLSLGSPSRAVSVDRFEADGAGGPGQLHHEFADRLVSAVKKAPVARSAGVSLT